jgi:hypothetical protein
MFNPHQSPKSTSPARELFDHIFNILTQTLILTKKPNLGVTVRLKAPI